MFNLLIKYTKNLSVFICCIPFCGCYFADGTKYPSAALHHSSGNGQSKSIYEIRSNPWFTGNGHIPFDFTVYNYDVVYELTLPAEVGTFSGKEVELSACGTKLNVISALIEAKPNSLKFNIEYNFEPEYKGAPKKLSGLIGIENSSSLIEKCVKPQPPFEPN
jgi:hypothetical protein